MEKLTGRHSEQKILAGLLTSGESELIAVYGRRRVGKTYLVRNYFASQLVFEFTGVHEAGLKDQLQNFAQSLQKFMQAGIPLATPANWIEAFDFLDRYIDTLDTTKPAVIFFDEFPWIHTPKSGFLQAFDHWWNSYASRRSQVKVVICGSAATWMIDNVINSRGGLHNRVTQVIRLLPFTLAETEEYLQSRGVRLDQYQLLQIYMAMGGVPQYLRNVQAGESAAQAIDRLCFTKDGVLKQEFDNLYRSLFADSTHHEKIIRALARKTTGLNRNEIIRECHFTSGGTTSRLLKELEESGFIAAYRPFGKTANDSLYKLSDEYSLFYLKFIDGNTATGKGTWLRQANSPSYRSWSGFAFESVCQKHSLQIRKALGIEGVRADFYSWRYLPGPGKTGAQIDLVLDRDDRCINLCEMKFTDSEFTIDKAYATELDNKVRVFREETNTKKTLFLTLVTTYGVKKNEQYLGRVQNEIPMTELFK
jgi:predicted AAA+ superfamily ATPase